ncbi:hypothetical protein MTO96_050568 [Rhipicephalus appendiculatus]
MLRALYRCIAPGAFHRRPPARPAPYKHPGTDLPPSVLLTAHHREGISAQWPPGQSSIQPLTPWPEDPGCPGNSSPALYSATNPLTFYSHWEVSFSPTGHRLNRQRLTHPRRLESCAHYTVYRVSRRLRLLPPPPCCQDPSVDSTTTAAPICCNNHQGRHRTLPLSPS